MSKCDHRYSTILYEGNNCSILWCPDCGAFKTDDNGWTPPSYKFLVDLKKLNDKHFPKRQDEVIKKRPEPSTKAKLAKANQNMKNLKDKWRAK